MAWFQKPGSKVGKLRPTRSNFFRQGDLISLLGAQPVFLPLKTNDVVVLRHDHDNPELGQADLASTLLNKTVYGPALVAEPQELEP